MFVCSSLHLWVSEGGTEPSRCVFYMCHHFNICVYIHDLAVYACMYGISLRHNTQQEGQEREGQNNGEQRHKEICGTQRDTTCGI